MRFWSVCVILSLGLGVLHAQDSGAGGDWEAEFFTIDGFRIAHYRFPTPEQAEGGVTLNVAQLRDLLAEEDKILLVDVQPVLFRHGRFILSEAHHAIPGSRWLPNVGHGDLLPEWQNYLSAFLAEHTRDHPDRPMVFYCTANCWMSWNTVKRVAEMGFRRLYWFRDGIEAWQEAGEPTEVILPEPR